VSGKGSWLVLVDSEKEVTAEGIVTALRKVRGATVTESVFGPSVDFEGCTVAVAFSAEPHVLVEAREIAEAFGKAHRDRDRVARCSRRFELTFEYAEVDVITNALCDIESELALLVEEGGGKTFAWNPQTQEFF
jgi:hypothetical protein